MRTEYWPMLITTHIVVGTVLYDLGYVRGYKRATEEGINRLKNFAQQIIDLHKQFQEARLNQTDNKRDLE